MGVTSGALTTGILETDAQAAPAAHVVGPGEVPITHNINGKTFTFDLKTRKIIRDS